MKKRTKILLICLGVLILLQFFRSEKNIGEIYSNNDVSNVISTSKEVKEVLEKACFDCHSNNTVYPWYYEIQPISFWLAHHVNEGKQELNFSEFKNYKLKRQLHKLEEVIEMIEDEEMPLSSYTIIHKEAKLTESEKQLLVSWAKEGMKSLKDSN